MARSPRGAKLSPAKAAATAGGMEAQAEAAADTSSVSMAASEPSTEQNGSASSAANADDQGMTQQQQQQKESAAEEGDDELAFDPALQTLVPGSVRQLMTLLASHPQSLAAGAPLSRKQAEGDEIEIPAVDALPRTLKQRKEQLARLDWTGRQDWVRGTTREALKFFFDHGESCDPAINELLKVCLASYGEAHIHRALHLPLSLRDPDPALLTSLV